MHRWLTSCAPYHPRPAEQEHEDGQSDGRNDPVDIDGGALADLAALDDVRPDRTRADAASPALTLLALSS